MRTKYILFLLLFLLLPSLALAGGYEKTITKIGDTQVPNGKMQISADGKYLYICNKSCNFVKFDVEQEAVVDTFAVPDKGENHLETFIVDRSGKYLIQQINGGMDGEDTIKTYDLTTKKKIRSISDFHIKDIYFYIFNFSHTKNDSVIAYSIGANGSYNNSSISGGGLYYYNFLTDSVVKSPLIDNEATILQHYSYDYSRMFLYNSYHYSTYSRYESSWTINTGFSVYENDVLIDKLHFEYYSHNGEVDLVKDKIMNRFAVDNTNDKIFCRFEKDTFRVYSLSDSAFIYKCKRSSEINNYIFPPSDFYYFGFSNKNGSIFVYHKQNHILIDTIQISGKIQNAHISKDSSCIYVLNDSGAIFRIGYELLGNAKKVALNSNTKQIQLGDTIQINDLSIGNFDTRKWIINGVEMADNSNLLKYVPEAKGLYSVELERQSGGSTYQKTEVDLFRVFERTKADFTYSTEDFTDSIGVNFVNASKGEELKFKWYFGDSETSVEVNPYHYYTKKGMYNVQLVAYNDFFADTMSMTEPIEFSSRSMVGIIMKSNREAPASKYHFEIPKAKTTTTFSGSNGFKITDGFGFSIVVEEEEYEGSYYGHDVYNYTYTGFLFIGSLNDDDSEITNDLFKTIYPTALKSHYINSNQLLLSTGDIFNWRCPIFSLYNYESNDTSTVFKDMTYKENYLFNSFITNHEILSIFHSNLISNSNLDSATMLININLSSKQQDTSYFDKMFFCSIPDNENSRISFISEENGKHKVYSYSLSSGLVPQFTLSNLDTILYADRNNEKEKYLFVSRFIQGNDSLLKLTITDNSGTIIKSETLTDVKTISDAKFTKDRILITPEGNPRLLVYDLDGNFKYDFSDNLVNGALSNITHLSENKALLVGTKYSVNSNIKGNIPSQSELYYVIDLGKVVSVEDVNPNIADVSTICCSPNPTNGDITFNFENAGNQNVLLKIIDPMGNELATLETSSDFISFPAAGLGSGIYLVRGIVGGKSISGKFVVAR